MAPRSVRKVLSAAVAALYFVGNVALAHAQEANLWNERRQHAADRRLASLPMGMAGPGPADLLRQIPALNRSLVSDARPLRGAADRKLPASIAPFFEAIPLNRASLKDVFISPRLTEDRAAPFVVLVEDVHLNREAQLNIAGVLGALCDKARELAPGNPLVVGIEAAFGPFDFKPFRAFSDKAALTAVADGFLAANKIAAPSYIGITSASDLTGFAGVDDEAHYGANVEAYRAAERAMPPVQAAIAKARAELAAAKSKSLNPELAKFDGLRSAYQQGTMGLGAYVSAIARLSDPDSFELVIEQFLSAYKIEQALDFPRVERERSAVVEKLATKLTAPELKDLLANALAYRAGRIGFADFYRGIKALIDKHGIPLSGVPAFDQYIRYVLLADGINGEKLFAAIQRTENALTSALSRTPEERALMERSRRLYLLDKLASFGLTPDEWSEYKSSKSTISGLPDLSAFEAFYHEADIRSESIVANLMERVGKGAAGAAPVGVLVVGGFHAPQISALLKKKGISYAVVQPNITKVDGTAGTEYLTIFTRDKAPLDKLFSGEKLFLGVAATEAGQTTGPAAVTNREIVAVEGAAQALRGGSTLGTGVDTRAVPGNADVQEVRAGGLTFFATLRAGLVSGFRSVARIELPGLGTLQILTRPAGIGALLATGTLLTVAIATAGWLPVLRAVLVLIYAGIWLRAFLRAPSDQRLKIGAQGLAMVGLTMATVLFGSTFGGENMAAMAGVVLPPGASTPVAAAARPVVRVEAGAPNNVERASVEEMVSDIRVRVALRKMQKLTGLVPRVLAARGPTVGEAEQKEILVKLWTSLDEVDRESIRQQYMGGVEPAAADLGTVLLGVARNNGQPFTGYSAYTGAGISMASGLPDWYDLRLETVLAIVENSARDSGLPADVIEHIRLIFQNNWKISPERTFGTLYNFLGPDLYGAMIALETGTPAASHFSLATMMFNGDIDHVVTLNFDTLIERAAYSLGMWKIVPTTEAELATGSIRIQAYDGQGARIGDPVTVRMSDVRNGQVNVGGNNVHLFYVSDETSATAKVLDGIGDLGVSILHKPHGSSEPGREHTIIADFEGTGQAAFPEAYRRYLLKILLTNYVSVFGVSMRDPDHSGMVRYIVSLIRNTDADIGPNSEFTDDQKALIRELRDIRDYVGAIPEGRGIHLVAHLGNRGVEESFAPAQRASMDDFARSGRAKVTVANTSAAMEAVAGPRPPVVHDPAGPTTDWRETIRDFFRGWGQRVVPAVLRGWLFSAMQSMQEADPSGRFERLTRAADQYTLWAADGSLRDQLRAISIKAGKEVPSLLTVVIDPLPLPATLDDLLKKIPSEDHPKVINGIYRLDYAFAGREALYKSLRARGLLEEWQFQFLMGSSQRDHLDERAAYESFGNAARAVEPYNLTLLIDGKEPARRAFFADAGNRADFFRAWAAHHQKLLALTEQFRLHRVSSDLPLPSQDLLFAADVTLRKFQGIFESADRENPGVFDVGQQRAGKRMQASTEESFLYMGFYSQLYALEAFQRDHKRENTGPLRSFFREEFVRLNGFDEGPEAVVSRIGQKRIDALRLAPRAGESPAAQATRVGQELLNAYFSALEANDESASFAIFLQIKDIFLNEQIARMKKVGGEGGNFILLLDVTVSLIENATVSNDLVAAGKWVREADQLKVMLTLGEDHWVVRLLARNKAYYQLKLAGTTADPARRVEILRQISGNVGLAQRYEFAADRSVWLMLKEVTALANFMERGFRLDGANQAAVLKPFNDIMLWFEQNPNALRNSELGGMVHIFSDYFDFMLLNGFSDYNQIYRNFPNLVAKLWSPTNGQNVTEAVRSVTIPRPNAYQMVGFYYHMQALYPSKTGTAAEVDAYRAQARAKAAEAYQGAVAADSNPERKTRHALRLVQFYNDAARQLLASGGSIDEVRYLVANARAVLDAIPAYLAAGQKSIAPGGTALLKPTDDQRLPIKNTRLETDLKILEADPRVAAAPGVVALTTPATLRAGRGFFRALGLGNAPDWVIRFLFSPIYEMFKVYTPGFFNEHFADGHIADTRANRIIVGSGIALLAVGGLVAIGFGFYVNPASLLQGALTAVALFVAAAIGLHAPMNGALDLARFIARKRIESKLLSAKAGAAAVLNRPEVRALSPQQMRDAYHAELAATLRGLFSIRPLGVGERSLRNEGLQALTGEIEQGQDVDRNLARLSVLLQKSESQFTAVETAVRAPGEAEGGSLAIQVFDGTETDLVGSFRALRDSLGQADRAVVYAPADRIAALSALLPRGQTNIRFEVYNATTIDFQQTVEAAAGLGAISRVKVLLSKNVSLSPEALQRLTRLEQSQYNVSIYLFLTGIAVAVTTLDLENMARTARLIATQA